MLSVKDQIGNKIEFNQIPKRIISLVPSQTELLYYLGLDKEIVGITKFCVYPKKWFHNKQKLGGTKRVHFDCIKNLQPDLIIANKEENSKEDIEILMCHYKVWVSDIKTINDALVMIQQIGLIVDKQYTAEQLIQSIQHELYNASTILKYKHRLKTAYLIWKNPYMTIGSDTFIHAMMSIAGLENIFANQTRYPIITLEEIQASNCEYLLLPSEPYPFKNEHVKVLKELLPNINVQLVDGEMFGWYGSRLLKSLPYLIKLRKSLA